MIAGRAEHPVLQLQGPASSTPGLRASLLREPHNARGGDRGIQKGAEPGSELACRESELCARCFAEDKPPKRSRGWKKYSGSLQIYRTRALMSASITRKPARSSRKACPKFLRQTFHEWAQHSMKSCRWVRQAFYDYLRTGCKEHHARFVHWHSSGNAFCSAAGKTKFAMKTTHTWRRSRSGTLLCRPGFRHKVVDRWVENKKPPVRKMLSLGLTSKLRSLYGHMDSGRPCPKALAVWALSEMW